MRPFRRPQRPLAQTLLTWAALVAMCLPTAALAAAARDCGAVDEVSTATAIPAAPTPAANHACCGPAGHVEGDAAVTPDMPRGHDTHHVPADGEQGACASACCYVPALALPAADVVACDGLAATTVLPVASLTDHWVNDPALPPPRV